MSEALTKQTMLQRSIQRALENFKKIGRANLTAAKIRARLLLLEKTWEDFRDGHATLVTTTSPSVKANLAYFTEDSFDSTEDAYLTAKDFMVDCLEEIEPPVSPLPATSHASSPGHATPAMSGLSLARLPPIQLPPYDGNYDEWESFRDRFHTLILANPDLNDFARMHYLVSSLKGLALDAIRDIPVTTDNLKIAWDTLTSRFENKRRLINSHFTALLGLSAVRRESPSDLQALMDRASVAVSSLKNLGRTPAELWNDLLIHIIAHKLDATTLKAWTLATNNTDPPPTFDDLCRFLSTRIRALEELAPASAAPSPSAVTSRRVHTATSTSKGPLACPLCQARHQLHACPVYLSKLPSQRREIVRNFKRCFNCLSPGHAVPACRSQFVCRLCQQKHHTSLHDGSNSVTSPVDTASTITPAVSSSAPTKAITTLFAATSRCTATRVLLATAWVKISVRSGRSAIVRALLDQGSEVSFITDRLAQVLQVPRISTQIAISAVGDVPVGTVKHAAPIVISPRNSVEPSFATTALILPTLTAYPPPQVSDLTALSHLADLSWADSDPTSPHPIDLLIGADLYSSLILDGVRKGHRGQPIAQNSVFGWVISGPLGFPPGPVLRLSDDASATSSSPRVSTLHCSSSASLADELRRFWELEELPRQRMLTPSDRQCEEHFLETHSRSPDGRYIVRLPFKRPPPPEIGESRFVAEKMFNALMRKFQFRPSLAAEYQEFMHEYEQLGHMQLAKESPAATNQRVFIPHHPVFRADSATTHLRVVFNASSVTSNGSSLNEHLLSGPKLQTDLSAVILRWRHCKYVYSADIAKMYRQILVDPRDVDFQRILWRPRSCDSQQEFQLLTVTYGMTCAPFLALRVLQQLVEDEGHRFPLAVPILRDHIYVDDVLFGGDDLQSTRQSRDALIGLLRRGQFTLRKWASNCSILLEDIDPSNHGLACTKHLAADESIKVLGIGWNPSMDAFLIQVSLPDRAPRTKRTILSLIAKLYDPLGWVTPVTILAKAFLQHLWLLRLEWDDNLPSSSLERWETIFSGLSPLRDLSIPRWTGLSATATRLELHGFADASNLAYAAAVYLKVTFSSGVHSVSLLAGKSKVAPLKPLTIPRLKLTAAALLTRLIAFVRPSLGSRPCSCYCWTDSTIVLAWLRDHPSRWQTFVANRVHDIQTRLPDAEWRHVPTTDNPADCASRGLSGESLRRHPLWWEGPAWLRAPKTDWPQDPPGLPSDAPLEKRVMPLHVSPSTARWDLATRFSSWPKLIRVTAYVCRFVNQCRGRTPESPPPSTSPRALRASECSTARTFWIKVIQAENFSPEIKALSDHRPLPTKSSIRSLFPFLDDDGVLRVGGRLENAPIAFHAQHPILLAPHPLVELIVQQAHLRVLHAGLQLTLLTLRQDFWVLRARQLVKLVLHACIVCVRERAAPAEQRMGDLPRVRVTPTFRCFAHCGVDYAGPVRVRPFAGRGSAARKAYIALFICLTTRAIHLELVSDCSTPAFINAFSRFCARRGLPQFIYSDNGTTFVGADKELAQAFRAALRDPDFQNTTAGDHVSWHFIPPSAPHFGGIWEAGVRSVKHHLRRVIRDHTLTVEEFSTLLCRIEACLNSRPLAPLRDSLDDYEPLTPGHFLFGSALTTAPEPSVLNLQENRLSRWQLVQHLTERMWKRWQTDYVNTLQQRTRWQKNKPPIKVGQLVLLQNSTLPPCKWALGRVTKLHTGTDGLTRVVTVKTATSEFTRAIVKLCVLPVTCDTPPEKL